MAGITTTTTITNGIRAYFDKKLLKYAVQETILDQFGDERVIPKNAGAKSISCFRYGAPSIAQVQALTEGTTPADSNAMDVAPSIITKALAQHGETFILTDIASATDQLQAYEEGVRRIGRDLGLWADSVTRNVLRGSNLTASNGSIGSAQEGGGTMDNTDVLTEVYGQPATVTQTYTGLNSATTDSVCNGDSLLDLATKLKKNRGQKIGDRYVYATDPRVARDLMRDTNWLAASNYGNGGKPYYRGEVGEIYGVKVIEQTNSFVSLGSATAADRFIYAISGGGGTGTGKDIISSFMFAEGAYGVPQLGGDNPFKPSLMISKGPQKSDPYNQRTYVAAKIFWQALRQNCTWYIVHMTKTGNTL